MILGQALSYKTKMFLKQNLSIRESVSYNNAQSIGVIYSNDTPEKTKLAERLKDLLQADGKKVKVLAYDRNVEVQHLPFESFSKKDLSFWGSFNKQSIDNFNDTTFDFLYCLDNNPGEIIKNILAKSKAKCRVGICDNFEAHQNTFELIVQSAKDSNVIDSVYSYTKKIR
jgi:hypothetical protein